MDIGVPAEIKTAEQRVSLTPAGAGELTARGHQVVVEAGAGEGAGFADREYKEAGAVIAGSADEVFDTSELVIKVKEPQAVERARLRPHHTLFTYLHLAADRPQTDDLLGSGATCIAYETVTDDAGRLPLLAPMSAIAGRMSIQAGAHALEAPQGGAGLLLGGVPGVRPGKVVIIGGGVVGEHAAEMAVGLGADVTVLDRNPAVLNGLAKRFGGRVQTVFSTRAELEAGSVEKRILLFPVSTPEDILSHPQLEARGYFQELEHPELGITATYPGLFIKDNDRNRESQRMGIRRRPPLIGEHNREIYLGDLRMSDGDLAKLKAGGII